MKGSLKRFYEAPRYSEYSDCQRSMNFRQICRVIMKDMKRRSHKKIRQMLKVTGYD
jgi:hypothetical protein